MRPVCCWLKAKRILLISESPFTIIQDGSIKQITEGIYQQISYEAPPAEAEPPRKQRVRTEERCKINGLIGECRRMLARRPGFLHCLAEELGIEAAIADEVFAEVMADYVPASTKASMRQQKLAETAAEQVRAGASVPEIAAQAGRSRRAVTHALQNLAFRQTGEFVPASEVLGFIVNLHKIDQSHLGQNQPCATQRSDAHVAYVRQCEQQEEADRRELNERIDSLLAKVWQQKSRPTKGRRAAVCS